MSKIEQETSDNVRTSVSSIYSDLLKKRTIEREEKEELRRIKEEEKKAKKEEKKERGDELLSKKERRQKEMDNWKEIVIGLTGDDLDYSDDSKKKKKKYRKWIDDDTDGNNITVAKTKKPKKRNYNKEFEPELQMLKSLVADQNKFSAEILKRYQNAMGPNTKDAAPPNKTMVDLIAAINSSRKNSLDMLNAIGSIKKTIADLYLRQKKQDAELGGGSVGTTDLGLMGSNIASSIFGESTTFSQPTNPQPSQPISPMESIVSDQSLTPTVQGVSTTFDPNSWDGPDLGNSYVQYENIPHHVVVEWKKDQEIARFKAVRDDTGEELVGAPVPTVNPMKLTFNEADLKVKGEFDEVYPLEIIS